MNVVILGLFHPEITPGGAQQVGYDLFKAAQQDPDVNATLIASVNTASHNTLAKPGAVINGLDASRPGEYLFLMSRFDHFWQSSNDDYTITELLNFLDYLEPDVFYAQHCLTWGFDVLNAIQKKFPNARMIFTFHEFISICNSRGQMVRNNSRELCSHASPIRCNQCFPEISPDIFTIRKSWMQQQLLQFDRFIAPTEFIRQRYIEWGLPEERVHVVENGISWQPSEVGTEPSSGTSRFAFFGQMLDNKGADVFLEALLRLDTDEYPNIEVDLYGGNLEFASKPFIESLESLKVKVCEHLGEDRVRFHGKYHHNQLEAALLKCDWVVVPSRWWEIFCLVVSEAWSAGKPVIVSDIGGLKERVNHLENGLKFCVDDATDLSEKLQLAINNPELWRKLHKNIPPKRDHHHMWRDYKALIKPSMSAEK